MREKASLRALIMDPLADQSAFSTRFVSRARRGAATARQPGASSHSLRLYSPRRDMPLAQLAVFEAVNTVTGEYQPDVGVLPTDSASAEAAAVSAGHRVQTTYSPANVPSLDAPRTTSLATIPDGDATQRGLNIGSAVVDAPTTLRATDESAALALYFPTASAPGNWQLTPSLNSGQFCDRHSDEKQKGP